MIFTELVLQNFGPYYGRQTIDLRPEKEGNPHPIILFGGMNGGGKTTLMDAIRLALYGSRARCSTRNNLSYPDFLNQAINHRASPIEPTRIELAFERVVNNEWCEYRVVRYWYKNSKDGKDNLGVLSGEWPDNALANTWDEYIENILPLGISDLFLFDGEQVKQLAENDSPPLNVIEAIQNLLGLELVSRLDLDLDILAGRKRKELLSGDTLKNMEEIELKSREYQEELDNIRASMTGLQENLERTREILREATDKFRSEGGRIAAERGRLEARKNELEKSEEIHRSNLRQLASLWLPLNLIFPLLESAIGQAREELDRENASIARDFIIARDERIIEFLKKLSLASDRIQEVEFFLREDRDRIDKKIERKNEVYLELEKEYLEEFSFIISQQIPQQINSAKRLLEELQRLEIERHDLEKELAIAAAPEEYETLSKNLEIAQKNHALATSDYENGRKKYEEIKKNIERTKKELLNYSERAIENTDNEHTIKSIVRARETLKLFKERLTLKKLNKLEIEVTECFRYLLHKSDLVHKITIDSDNFSLTLFDPEGRNVPKNRLSAGEKQLLAIGFLWGLARVSGRQLPIAIDTPLGRLDSSHRQNLIERYFPAASHQVILLSTDTEIGENEVKFMREQEAIAREYLLKYDSNKRQTEIVNNAYFY